MLLLFDCEGPTFAAVTDFPFVNTSVSFLVTNVPVAASQGITGEIIWLVLYRSGGNIIGLLEW